MAEHYTRSTVEAKRFCKKCNAFTMHNVMGGQLGACQVCLKRLADAPKVAAPAKQESLF